MAKHASATAFSMKHLFFWLSGAGTQTLEQCPTWEQRKYAAFGATVLVPCLFAFMAAAYALSTLTNHLWIILPAALAWAFIILTIDRALMASYRPYQRFILKSRQFALRFVVAFLMGLTVAHPLVLLLFRDTITTVIEDDRQAEIEQLHASYAKQRDQAQARISVVEKTIADQRRQWDQSFQAKFNAAATDTGKVTIPGLSPKQKAELERAVSEATAPARQALAADDAQIASLTPQFNQVQQELAFWQSEFERELNGQRSGIKGVGPRARSIRDDQMSWRQAKVNRLGDQLKHFTSDKTAQQRQISQIQDQVRQNFANSLAEQQSRQKAEQQRLADLQHQIQQDQAGQFVAQQNQLRETIKAQIDARLADLKLAQQQYAQVNTEEQRQVDIVKAQPRRDILTQTLALHKLFDEKSKAGQFALSTYIVLVLLFMLVDTIPVIIKFFCKPGPYDTLLDRDEVRYEAEHQVFLSSHQQYMQNLANSNALAVTRNKPLEDALIDAVEHSRVAREFLDSLIALEKSFNDTIEREEQAAGPNPEKIAALQAMKKRFYDDLHQRIESFFSKHDANINA